MLYFELSLRSLTSIAALSSNLADSVSRSLRRFRAAFLFIAVYSHLQRSLLFLPHPHTRWRGFPCGWRRMGPGRSGRTYSRVCGAATAKGSEHVRATRRQDPLLVSHFSSPRSAP